MINYLYKYIKITILTTAVFFILPQVTLAQANLTFETTEDYIEYLQDEIVRLQDLLQRIISTQDEKVVDTGLDRYLVANNTLIKIGHGKVDPVHLQIFRHLQQVLGADVVNKYISEFKVGFVNDGGMENYIEGFVFTDSERDDWDFEIKRDSRRALSEDELELFTELFLHEYAHILIQQNPSFANSFTNKFWSNSTYELSDAVSRIYDKGGYAAVDDKYYGHRDTFVSGYAMISPDEDMAETFANFVEEETFSTREVVDAKKYYFYNNSFFNKERLRLRNNIGWIN